MNVRVGVPTNLCVKESWSECALESLRGCGVNVFAPLCENGWLVSAPSYVCRRVRVFMGESE